MLKNILYQNPTKFPLQQVTSPAIIAGLESVAQTLEKRNFLLIKLNILLASIISDDWLVKVDLEKYKHIHIEKRTMKLLLLNHSIKFLNICVN